MTPHQQAQQELQRYVQRFPEEAQGLQAVARQLDADQASILQRSNMTGHLTSSVLGFDPLYDKVLLIHHAEYDMWIPAGGHHEGSDSLLDSALREGREETALRMLRVHRWSQVVGPLDIDSHPIAARPGKNEGPHAHHDFLYLAIGDSTLPLVPQKSEVLGAKWISRQAMGAIPNPRLVRLAQKLNRLRNPY